ncbi:MAG TPA: hypothetical protein VK843_11110 [Planctomycetota bacterium]|nr:hypothetical protein [Planctomycetota bacterium]
MESFEKRKRERKKQELRKEKAARKLQGLEASGPSQADYFADLDPVSKVDAGGEEEPGEAAKPEDALEVAPEDATGDVKGPSATTQSGGTGAN